MKIVFMGTPDFAVGCLERIIADGHDVCGVFCRADKLVGRKQVLTAPPVKVCALNHKIEVFQPERIKNNPEVLAVLNKLAPDLIVVVAYGRILPKEVLNLPKYGAINIHGSLLPRHRGASPIQWSIVCGDKETGITSMQMDEGLDTGDMLLQQRVEISQDETGESLFEKLCTVGAEVLSNTIKGIENHTLTPVKQDEALANYAPIIQKEMGCLDFTKTAEELDCLVRGFTPWPATYFTFENRRYKVLKAKPQKATAKKTSGTVYYENNKMFIQCADQTALNILEICPEGKKKMTADAFINGRFIAQDTKL